MKNNFFPLVMAILGIFLVAKFTANNKFWSQGLPGVALVALSSTHFIKKYGD